MIRREAAGVRKLACYGAIALAFANQPRFVQTIQPVADLQVSAISL